MAQIWVTYKELADFTEGTTIAAREASIENGWARRRSRDGLTRVRLPREVAALYMRHCVRQLNFSRADTQGEGAPTSESCWILPKSHEEVLFL